MVRHTKPTTQCAKALEDSQHLWLYFIDSDNKLFWGRSDWICCFWLAEYTVQVLHRDLWRYWLSWRWPSRDWSEVFKVIPDAHILLRMSNVICRCRHCKYFFCVCLDDVPQCICHFEMHYLRLNFRLCLMGFWRRWSLVC